MKLTLGEFLIFLTQKKPFYGRLVSSLQRVAKPSIGTMAVGVRDGRPVFFYNPAFVEDLDVPSALFAVEHEMLHLVLDHIPRFLELLALQPSEVERRKAQAVYNIAMDCAINTMLRDHEGFERIEQVIQARIQRDHPDAPADPRNGMALPEKFDLPREGAFESYQYLLMRQVKLIDVAVSLIGGSDHSMWGDPGGEGDGDQESTSAGGGPGDKPGKGKGKGRKPGGKKGPIDITFDGPSASSLTTDELMSQAHRVREAIKQALRSTIRHMGGIGRGTVPSEVAQWLEAYLADPIIPWWEVFTTRARTTRAAKYNRSVIVPNRALIALSEEDKKIIPMPGRTRSRTWRVFLMVDTSGSMSDDSLEIVKSELQHMLAVDEDIEIRYMEGDAAVHTDLLLHHGDEIPHEVVGRGGTDFDSYFVHMGQYLSDESKAPDLVIVYTDGFAPAVRPENRLPLEIPVLWLVTPQYSEHFASGYGEVIVCDPDHNERYESAA